MNRFFGEGNPIWNVMELVFDVFLLNVLWLLCCLPVFTIGPSTTAFFYAQINLARGEESYVSKDFFRSFRQNFKQGILLGLPLTLIGTFLALDISLCYHAGRGIYTFFMVFFAILFLFWAFVTLYAFPLLAKFDKKNKEIISLAFVLSMKHFLLTILMLIILAIGLWLCHILIGLVFIVFGLVGRFHAMLFAYILKPYLPDAHSGEDPETPSFSEESK